MHLTGRSRLLGLLMYRPRRNERLRWPSWLTYSGRFTREWSSVGYRPSAEQGQFAGH